MRKVVVFFLIALTLTIFTATASLPPDNNVEKLSFLQKVPKVDAYLSTNPQLNNHLENATTDEKIAILSTIAIGQGDNLFHPFDGSPQTVNSLQKLTKILVDTERFYLKIGGIIGYHDTVQSLIDANNSPNEQLPPSKYYQPKGISLTKPSEDTDYAIKQYILNMPAFGEMYPIGGAGDRLNLIDEETGEPLPAALLPFTGRNLLSGMIRDLQSREFLYHRLTGKQQITPVAMMTSLAKDNHKHILEICEKDSWFGRPIDSFRLFTQIQVPVISTNGDWMMKGPLELNVKPGGHGVIWQTAKDNGILDWFHEDNRVALLLRQVNNPIANTDYGLLAFLGFGIDQGKQFGFASCQRIVGSAVGMNVLKETKVDDTYRYSISNIEYTEFSKLGIDDTPVGKGSPYSSFPGNTNILFGNISTIESCIEKCPIPGMIINMKSPFTRYKEDGTYESIKGGRLESTMQNIADFITDSYPERIDPPSATDLKTYLTFNHTKQTLSVTKKSYTSGGPIADTPSGGYYDLQSNYYDLLTQHCQMDLPALPYSAEYVESGPACNVLIHPAIGPLWSVIAQKIRSGKIHPGSELQLEVAEVDIENLNLAGSLIVEATHPLGSVNEDGIITYDYDNGKCTLINVTVQNAGINRSANNTFWKNEVKRNESLQIILHGQAEFHAENITITGNHRIEVPDGYRVVAEEVDGEVQFMQSSLTKPSWYWSYTFDSNDRITLQKKT